MDRPILGRALRTAGGIAGVVADLLLAGSWCWLLRVFASRTPALLAPWHDYYARVPPCPPLPDLEPWERVLNELFGYGPGVFLPGALVVTGSMLLFVSGAGRGKPSVILPLAFLGANLVFLQVHYELGPAVSALAAPAPQSHVLCDVGYHRTWPELLLLAVLSGALLWGQLRLRMLGGTGRLREDREQG